MPLPFAAAATSSMASLLGRSGLSAAKYGASYVAIEEALEFAGEYSDFVKDNKDFVLAVVAVAGVSRLAASGVTSLSRTGKVAQLKSWLASSVSTVGANIARRTPISVGVTKRYVDGKLVTAFRASYSSGRGEEFVECLFNKATKQFEWKASNPMLIPLLVGTPVGGLAILADDDPQAEQDFATSLGAATAELSGQISLSKLRRSLASKSNADIVSSMRGTIDGYTVAYPELGEDMIASEVMNSLNLVEDESYPTLFEHGRSEDDKPILRINGLQYVYDEEKGEFNYAPAVVMSESNAETEASVGASDALQAMINQYSALGALPFARNPDGGEITPPIIASGFAAYVVRLPMNEEGQRVTLDELDGGRKPAGWMYYLGLRETTLSEDVLDVITEMTGGYFSTSVDGRDGFLDISAFNREEDGDWLDDAGYYTLLGLDKAEDIGVAGGDLVADWMDTVYSAAGKWIDSAADAVIGKENKEEATTVAESSSRGLFGAVPNSDESEIDVFVGDEDISRDYNLESPMPVFRAMGVIL